MWEVTKVKDNAFPVIKLDNGRAVMVKIYYGEECQSDGMSKDEYDECLRMFSASKAMLETLMGMVDAGPPSCADAYSEEGVDYDWNRDVKEPALAAIFKATGKHYTAKP